MTGKEKTFPKTANNRRRRQRALVLLENQLKAGYKPRKVKRDGMGEEPYIPLTQLDIARIQSQIETLKQRL